MSLRQKLLQIKADWEKWEDRLSIEIGRASCRERVFRAV